MNPPSSHPLPDRTGVQPAGELLRHPRRRTLFAILLAAVVTALVSNLGVGWLLEAYPANRGYALIGAKWGLLDNLEGPLDILIVGDSSCHVGVNPRVIEERTGATSLNLCTLGKHILLDDYWMLDTHIRKYGPPGMVIAGHVYDVWHRSLDGVALGKIPMGAGFWDRYIAPLDMKPRDLWRLLLTRYVPLYAENKSLSKVLMRPWRLGRRDVGIPPDGFLGLERAEPGRVRRDARDHREFARESTFEISPENRMALDGMAALAREHGFEIYIVNAPMYDRLFEDAAIRAYLAEIEAFFEGYARAQPNIHYLFAAPRLYPETAMEIVDHVTAETADLFTRDLIDTIMARRAAPPD